MRQQLLDGIRSLSLDTFSVSDELPWVSSDTPLYIKNKKVFYVGEPETTESELISTLNSGVNTIDLGLREVAISVFVTVDAKSKPSNYDSLIADILNLKNLSTILGVTNRQVDKEISFLGDAMLTEFEFRFSEIAK